MFVTSRQKEQREASRVTQPQPWEREKGEREGRERKINRRARTKRERTSGSYMPSSIELLFPICPLPPPFCFSMGNHSPSLSSSLSILLPILNVHYFAFISHR